MTQTYNLRSTTLAYPSRTFIHELEMNTGTAASSTVSHTETFAGVDNNTVVWGTAAGQPNSAAWPVGTGGNPYKIVVNLTVMGSAMILSTTTYQRCDSTLNELTISSTGTWDSTTGTGLKTNTHTSWDPYASGGIGVTDQRWSVAVLTQSSSGTMNNTITFGTLNTSTTFATHPLGGGGGGAENIIEYIGGGYYG